MSYIGLLVVGFAVGFCWRGRRAQQALIRIMSDPIAFVEARTELQQMGVIK